MFRALFLLVAGISVGAGGMSLAHHDEHSKGGDYVKVLSQRDIIEKVDGNKAKATTVEVIAPSRAWERRTRCKEAL